MKSDSHNLANKHTIQQFDMVRPPSGEYVDGYRMGGDSALADDESISPRTLDFELASKNHVSRTVAIRISPWAQVPYVTITDSRGQFVRHLPVTSTNPANLHVLWDGKNNREKAVSAGNYVVRAHGVHGRNAFGFSVTRRPRNKMSN